MKQFIRGFIKGFLILFIFTLILLILMELKFNTEPILLICNLIMAIYIFSANKKNKQPNAWIIVSLLFGFLTLPFYFGTTEMLKNKDNL